MKVKVMKTHKDARLPTYATKGSAGMDFYALEECTLHYNEVKLVRTGIAMKIPDGYELQLRLRSSIGLKTKLRLGNAVATIDNDFLGEILLIVENTSNNVTEDYKITKGQRIAQGVLNKVEQATFLLVEELDETERGSGGFGSTGQ